MAMAASGSAEGMDGDGDVVEALGEGCRAGRACLGPEGDYSSTLSSDSTDSASLGTLTASASASCTCSSLSTTITTTTTRTTTTSTSSAAAPVLSTVEEKGEGGGGGEGEPLHPAIRSGHVRRLSPNTALVRLRLPHPVFPDHLPDSVLPAFAKLSDSALEAELLAEAGRGTGTFTGFPRLLQSRPLEGARWLLLSEPCARSLADLSGPLEPRLVAALLADVADGLDFLHCRRLAHKRLAPPRVRLTASHRAVLTGLGGVGPDSLHSPPSAFAAPPPLTGTREGDLVGMARLGRHLLGPFGERGSPAWLRRQLMLAEGAAWSGISAARLALALRDALAAARAPLTLALTA